MAGMFDDIAQLAALAQSFDSSKYEGLIDSVSQAISASSASQLSDAADRFKAAGENPSEYIAKPRAVLRQKQVEHRLQMERELHEQRLQQNKEIHEAQLRIKAIEERAMSDSVTRLNA